MAKSPKTTKKYKRTASKTAKKKQNDRLNGILFGIGVIILIIVMVLVLDYFGMTDVTKMLFPDLYAMIYDEPTPTMTAVLPTATANNSSAAADVPASSDWYTVYFTDPVNINDSSLENSPVHLALIERIDHAEATIDIAAFEFNLVNVADALIAAEKRGVEVRWVTDDEYGILEDEEDELELFPKMEKAGVEVKDDARTGLMHNKYIIFDSTTVWTGSTNITENGFYRNNNNVVVIESQDLAAIYTVDFEEMWSGQFGADTPSQVGQQAAVVNGTTLTAYFSPDDGIAAHLTELLQTAQKSIYFMAFSYTHDDMGYAMLDKFKAGMTVEGVFETRSSQTEYSELPLFYCAGMNVRQDGNPRTFHHKVIIIDERIVVTGSFNFSQNADKSNNENALVIENAEIAQLFLQEYQTRWQEANEVDTGTFTCP